MAHRKHDRSAHRNELAEIAQELSWHYRRQTVVVTDVEQWLYENQYRRTGALLVVWDRSDAAVLEHRRSDVQVHTAAPLMAWMRHRRQQRIVRPEDIAGPAANSDDPSASNE